MEPEKTQASSDSPSASHLFTLQQPLKPNPVVPMPDLKRGTLKASVIIGSFQSVLNELKSIYPVTGETDETKRFFYLGRPFEDQLSVINKSKRYRRHPWAYGVVVFGVNIPESELTDELRLFPKNVREMRAQRVEIHR